MPTNLITITNVSKQAVPILVNSIPTANASTSSTIPANIANQTMIPPGAEVTIEVSRIDLGQLNQLRSKNLISHTY